MLETEFSLFSLLPHSFAIDFIHSHIIFTDIYKMIKQIAPKSIQKSPMMCTPTKVTTKILPPDVRVQEGITEGKFMSVIVID